MTRHHDSHSRILPDAIAELATQGVQLSIGDLNARSVQFGSRMEIHHEDGSIEYFDDDPGGERR